MIHKFLENAKKKSISGHILEKLRKYVSFSFARIKIFKYNKVNKSLLRGDKKVLFRSFRFQVPSYKGI